jgi:hypothetical protein
MRLDPGVFDEGRPGFLGFRQSRGRLAEDLEIPKGSSSVRDLVQLALVVGRHQKRSPVKRRMSGDGPGLRGDQRLDPLVGEVMHLVELRPAEGRALGAGLHLDQRAGAGHDEVAVVPASLSSA